MKGLTGTSQGGVEVSAGWRRRARRTRVQEEQGWAAQSGPVTTRQVEAAREAEDE
jgi:hypothetical protein